MTTSRTTISLPTPSPATGASTAATPSAAAATSSSVPASTGSARRAGRRWRALLVLVLVAVLAGATDLTPAAAGVATQAPDPDGTLTWSVQPTPSEDQPARPNFAVVVEAGTTVRDQIRVRNYDDQPLALDIYASDAITASTGAIDLLPAGTPSTDVGSWITLDRSTIEVPARGFVDVPFVLAVPAGAESGDHTGGIVTSYRTPGSDAEGRPVVLDRRLGSRVQVRVSGELRPSLAISDVTMSFEGTANPLGRGTAHVAYTVTNDGNVRVGGHQRVSVAGVGGLGGQDLELADMGELLPGNSLTFTVAVADVWPGVRTTATVEVTPFATREGDQFADVVTARAAVTEWTVPWSSLALVAALVALALVGRWQRARRIRAEQARIDAAVKAAVGAGTGSGLDGSTPGADRVELHTGGADTIDLRDRPGEPTGPTGHADADARPDDLTDNLS